MKSIELKKIIWAVDVFTDIPQIEEVAAHNIACFLKSMKSSAPVIPVCIFPEFPTDGETQFAKREIQKRMASLAFPNLRSVEIITESLSTTMPDQVSSLLKYAKSVQADLIVATTHGKRGFGQYLLGSFSYELIRQSSIPLYIIDPECEFHDKFSKFLVPIGNEGIDREDGRLALSFAKSFHARLTLYQHVDNSTSSFFPVSPEIFDVLKIQKNQFRLGDRIERRRLKNSLGKDAKNWEIKTEVDTQPNRKSVVQYIKKEKFDLVVLFSGTKKKKNPLPSKISKYVVEHSSCPVLIF